MKVILSLGLLLALVTSGFGNKLEVMEPKELDELIRNEQFVLVLFSDETTDEGQIEDYEVELASVREDLVDSLNAWVLKSHNHPVKNLLLPDAGNKPVIAFFREGIPVLYDGPANEEEMLEIISRNKERCVKDLSDLNFEHLTQASTGATTGDWFVMFYKDDCEECEAMEARLETLACRHKGRLNVARIDRGESGAVTARRFGVSTTPSYILFRLGRMYRYEIEKHDVESMSSFVTGWYKNVKGENIPLPKTPFDDFVQMCADYIRDEPLMVAGIVGVPILLALIFYFLLRSEEKPKKKKKKDKSKEKKAN